MGIAFDNVFVFLDKICIFVSFAQRITLHTSYCPAVHESDRSCVWGWGGIYIILSLSNTVHPCSVYRYTFKWPVLMKTCIS